MKLKKLGEFDFKKNLWCIVQNLIPLHSNLLKLYSQLLCDTN